MGSEHPVDSQEGATVLTSNWTEWHRLDTFGYAPAQTPEEPLGLSCDTVGLAKKGDWGGFPGETPRDGHPPGAPPLSWAFSLAARGRSNQEVIPSLLPNAFCIEQQREPSGSEL